MEGTRDQDEDIVARLERIAGGDLSEFPPNNWGTPLSKLMRDAAEEIKQLRADIEMIRVLVT